MSAPYRTLHGIHLVKLKGNSLERARQHFEILKDAIEEGPLHDVSKKNEYLIRKAKDIPKQRWVRNLLVQVYDGVILRKLAAGAEPELREILNLGCEISGKPKIFFDRSCYQADAMMLLARLTLGPYSLKDVSRMGIPGCTSAVMMPEWTAFKEIAHCRNFDYPLVGRWEKAHTLLFHEPSEKGQIPYTVFTAAGIHAAGITGMNSAGLTLAVHAHVGQKIGLNGQPITWIGERVLQRAKTIAEAIEILKSLRRLANWTLIISSSSEKRSVAIEMGQKEVFVREMNGGFLRHTNYYLTPKLREREIFACGALHDDLEARFCRAKDFFEPKKGKVTLEDCAHFLGDHLDPSAGVERVFGNTVSASITLQSVVMLPDSQRMLTSFADHSPTGLGDFVDIPLNENAFTGAEGSFKTIAARKFENPKLKEAIAHYREAYRLWSCEEPRDSLDSEILSELMAATDDYPQDAHVWMSRGFLEMHSGHFKQALSSFQKAKHLPVSPNLEQVLFLFEGRCFDLLENHEEARACYERGVQKVQNNPKLKKAFQKALRTPFHKSKIKYIQLDLQFPEGLNF